MKDGRASSRSARARLHTIFAETVICFHSVRVCSTGCVLSSGRGVTFGRVMRCSVCLLIWNKQAFPHASVCVTYLSATYADLGLFFFFFNKDVVKIETRVKMSNPSGFCPILTCQPNTPRLSLQRSVNLNQKNETMFVCGSLWL